MDSVPQIHLWVKGSKKRGAIVSKIQCTVHSVGRYSVSVLPEMSQHTSKYF